MRRLTDTRFAKLATPLAFCFGLSVALSATALTTNPAAAQFNNDRLERDVGALDDRLNRLERTLKDVEREVYSIRKKGKYKDTGYNTGPAASSASSVRLDELESLIRTLNGLIEETRYDNRRLQQQLEAWSGDVDYRLRAIEEKLGISPLPSVNEQPFQQSAPNPNAPRSTLGDRSDAGDAQQQYTTGQGGVEIPVGLDEHLASSMGTLGETRASDQLTAEELAAQQTAEQRAVPTVSSLGTPDAVTVEGGAVDTTIQNVGPAEYASLEASGVPSSPGALYEHARNRLLARDFASAQESFRVFLNLYGDHSRAGEAQYWLGESFYAQGQYKEAGQQFAQGMSKYPQSPKAPETLLKLGMSLVALGQNQAGCKSFSEMRTRFPNVAQALALRADRERERAGCS